MREITIRLPFLLPLENVQMRTHFHQKTSWKKMIAAEFVAAGLGACADPIVFAEVTVWRHSTHEPDYTGLCGSLKQLLDILQPPGVFMPRARRFQNPGGLGIILSDRTSNIVVRPFWVKSRLSEQHTLIRIRELAEMPKVAA